VPFENRQIVPFENRQIVPFENRLFLCAFCTFASRSAALCVGLHIGLPLWAWHAYTGPQVEPATALRCSVATR